MIKPQKIILFTILIAAVATAAIYFFARPAKDSGQQSFLASIYNNKENYEDVFSKLPVITGKPEVKAGIISHHFLAKQLIADFYNKIGSDKPFTIFLVSPDHYNSFFPSGVIAYTSELPWQTPFGDLPVNKKIINSLLKGDSIKTSDSVLGLEHGVYVEAPFIKKFFPNATIVPLVVNMGIGYNNFLELGNKIKDLAGGSSILIVSSDFSHNISASEAGIKDKESVEVLKNLQTGELSGVNNDCRQCLAVLSGFLPADKNYSFNLIDNKNSFDFFPRSGTENKDSVTSYVSGFYAEKKDLQILFTGDLMFDRGIRYYAKQSNGNEFIFDKIYPALANNDLVVANLEGPITDEKSVSSGTTPGSTNNYFFTFDPSVAETLFRENIKLVDLGNNHILNFGSKGLASTKKYLDIANVGYFGAPQGDRSIIKNIGGLKIAFVSYNEFTGDILAEQKSSIDEIKKVKLNSDIVIVFSHWGVEYSLEPTDAVKNLAHQFIDAGADLIIGSHPHVIEPMEIYNGKRIYYSLGNFVFDQYFNEDVRNGMGVIVKIDPATKQLDFEEKKFYLQTGGQTLLR